MHRLRVVAGCALFLVLACAVHRARAGALPVHSIQAQGRERTYVEFVPAHPEGKPLVVALHGRLGTSEGQDELSHLSQLAAAAEAVVVMPQGIDRSWADFRHATPASKQNVDDVEFLRTLIDDRLAAWHLDASRVYMIGMSNGGFMTLLAGCRLADRLAAIASVTGGVAVETRTDCALARPLPVMFVMGDADPLVPWAGGPLMNHRGEILSAVDGAALYAQFDGCTERTETPLPPLVDDGTSVSRTVFSGCQGGSEVQLLRIHGGGHAWPGGKGYLPEAAIGKTSKNLDASSEAWQFFKRFSRQ